MPLEVYREGVYLHGTKARFEDDPNLTDKRFPGNPTRSYRSREPLRVLGEVTDWVGHPPELVERMREGIAAKQRAGKAEILD